MDAPDDRARWETADCRWDGQHYVLQLECDLRPKSLTWLSTHLADRLGEIDEVPDIEAHVARLAEIDEVRDVEVSVAETSAEQTEAARITIRGLTEALHSAHDGTALRALAEKLRGHIDSAIAVAYREETGASPEDAIASKFAHYLRWPDDL